MPDYGLTQVFMLLGEYILTSSIFFFWPSFTFPAKQQCASAFWIIYLLDLALGSLKSFGPMEEEWQIS